jgi:membrane-bound ClpP family serine protease
MADVVKFKRVQDWANAVLALWIAISPAIFPIANGSGITVFAGIALVLLAIWGLASPKSRAAEWLLLVLAAFLFFVPWMFGYAGAAATNVRIVTVVMVVLAVTVLFQQRKAE